jgi:deoxyhypusine monooxygenase
VLIVFGIHLDITSIVDFFRELLLNELENMYERYAALFALKNDGGDYVVSAIFEVLGVKSALLRHEVCLNFNQVLFAPFESYFKSLELPVLLKNRDEYTKTTHVLKLLVARITKKLFL